MAFTPIVKGTTNWDEPLNAALSGLDAQLTTLSRPNLLDNWYFAADSVIDQRGGYVVPPGTAYYSDTGLATSAGTVSAYTAATYVNATYGSITVSSATYYVAYADMVRGYVGSYTQAYDRWIAYHSAVILDTDGAVIARNSNDYDPILTHRLPSEGLAGRTATVSALCGNTLITVSGIVPLAAPSTTTSIASMSQGEWYLDLGWSSIGHMYVEIRYTGDQSSPVRAAKLELGDTQTLARQDESGNWVLIDPPPNPATELAKCQRYYRRLRGMYSYLGAGFAASSTVAYVIIPIAPTMRISASDDSGSIKLVGTAYLGKTGAVGTNSIAVASLADAAYVANSPALFTSLTASGLTPGEGLLLSFRDTTSYLEISVDL